jgi:hypothetical protein
MEPANVPVYFACMIVGIMPERISACMNWRESKAVAVAGTCPRQNSCSATMSEVHGKSRSCDTPRISE